MSEEEIQAEEPKPKQLSFGSLLLISLALFNGVYVFNELFRWSNPIQGLVNGLIHCIFYSIAWLIIFIPWSLLVMGLYVLFKRKKWRSHVVLSPVYLIVGMTLLGLIIQPPTAAKRFEGSTGIEFPKGVKNLKRHFSGGGIADYMDLYSFETTPDEVDRLIEGMGIDLGMKGTLLSEVNQHSSVQVIPGGPDYRDWSGAIEYSKHDFPKSGWFCYLITDESRTKVYIMVGCI